MSKIWDLTQTIHPDLEAWPGEPKFSKHESATISDQCPVNVGVYTMSAHTGTHADSPYHYDAEGLDMASCDLNTFIGKCQLLDVTSHQGIVSMEDIKEVQWKCTERILFRTYEKFPHNQWNENFTAIHPEVINHLASIGCKLIGTDAASVDPQTSKTLDAHMAVKINDMRILEGLVLENIPEGVYELIALPLKIQGGDGSPLRAVLREL